MALPNPIYIDAEAMHPASAMRLLAYTALEGQEGVLNNTDLAVKALGAPGGAIQVMPGAYVVRAKHTGGENESYAGKVIEAETVSVNPTSSSAGRTDLVILRIENPYVAGSGSWAQPADPVNGPYASIRIIEGVPANTQSVIAYNNTWSAITLARIVRPANTTIVDQSHITDLRQLASLQNERIIIINNPPPEPPPIAFPMFSESSLADTYQELVGTQTGWTKFPSQVSWDVPIPSWARGMDIHIMMNVYFKNHCWGEMRLIVEGETTSAAPTVFDFNYTRDTIDMPDMRTLVIGGTESLNPSWCGRTKKMWLEGHFMAGHTNTAKLTSGRGSYVNALLVFKKYPTYD